jgi:hypothetical protein
VQRVLASAPTPHVVDQVVLASVASVLKGSDAHEPRTEAGVRRGGHLLGEEVDCA